jgi:hypothetical protein
MVKKSIVVYTEVTSERCVHVRQVNMLKHEPGGLHSVCLWQLLTDELYVYPTLWYINMQQSPERKLSSLLSTPNSIEQRAAVWHNPVLTLFSVRRRRIKCK